MAVLRRVHKWVWIPLALLVIGGMLVSSLWSHPRDWETAQRWASERVRQAAADGCPVLMGVPVDGCSRTDYREAIRLAGAWPAGLSERLAVALPTEDAEPSSDSPSEQARPGDLRIAAAAVARLRDGARRREDVDTGQVRFGSAALTNALDVELVLALFNALRLEAGERAGTDPAAASAELLDGVVVALDLATAGWGFERYVGMVALERVIAGFDDALLRRCDGATLERLGDVLARASEALPDSRDFLESGLAHLVVYLAEEVPLTPMDVGANSRWVAWRSGLSLRAYAVRKLCDQISAVERHLGLVTPRNLPWPQRSAALQRVVDEAGGHRYGMFDLSSTTMIEREWRKADVALQQLRLAVAFHAGVDLPVVPDKLGDGALQVDIIGDEAVFRSANANLERKAKRAPR